MRSVSSGRASSSGVALVGFGHDAGVFVRAPPGGARRAAPPRREAESYGGSAEHEVDTCPARPAQETQHILARDVAAADPDGVQVALDRGHRARVALDEDGARGAARERLDAERAGARVEVEHARAVDVPEDREERLADAVGGRARGVPRGACRRRPL